MVMLLAKDTFMKASLSKNPSYINIIQHLMDSSHVIRVEK